MPTKTEGMTVRAIVSIRVSTDEQVCGGVSLDTQEERLRADCTMTGLELVVLIREEGVSGGKPLGDRPGGREVDRARHRNCYRAFAQRLPNMGANTLSAQRNTVSHPDGVLVIVCVPQIYPCALMVTRTWVFLWVSTLIDMLPLRSCSHDQHAGATGLYGETHTLPFSLPLDA